jgi:hypothetical protein
MRRSVKRIYIMLILILGILVWTSVLVYSSLTQYMFRWYVIAPGGGYSSSGSHTTKFISVGQVFTGNAQDSNYKIFSGYIAKPDSEQSDVREEQKGQLPYAFELSQNYPNPFNPITNIQFCLSKQGHVRLYIYNILGQKVTTLLNEILPAGYKIVTWDGTDDNNNEVASGVYFYKLRAGEYSETKEMILMK